MASLTRSVCVTTTFVLTLLSLLPTAGTAEEIPGPLTIQVCSGAPDKPLGGVTVHVGGRMAVSNPIGTVVFDGVPAGAHEIRCVHPGHDEFRRPVELRTGVRETQMVILVPEVVSPLRLRLIEETSGEPVGHARVHMAPKALASALRGPMVFSTDSLGDVATIPIPHGTYHLTIKAQGFEEFTQDLEHKTMDQPVECRLKAVVQPMSCAIEALGEGGKPLSGAQVELWEVYPVAKIASGTTDATGTAVFANLRRGIVNPTAEDKSLPVTHRAEVVVRVQSEGYVDAVQSVRLTNGGRLSIMLEPQKTIPEQPSNDSQGTAQLLKIGQTASFKIDKPTDEDWFRFELREPARLTVEFNACPLPTTAVAFDSAGRQVLLLNRYGGNPGKGVCDLAAGRYTIKVTSWGMTASSEAEILMKVSAETAADPLEPNDDAAGARPIEIGQHMRGLVFPVGDADHFTLRLDRPGRLKLESVHACNLSRTVAVQDKNGNTLVYTNFYGGAGGAADWPFAAGEYRVVVTAWGNSNCSLDPYDFRFVLMTDDGVDDPVHRPGTRISSVRYLDVPGRTYASLNPVDDRDIYALSIPSGGTLHMFQQGATDLTVRLLDGLGNVLVYGNSYGNNVAQFAHSFQAATTVYAEVTTWSRVSWSPFPYELRTWFDPVGEVERIISNDTMKTAVPIELGAIVRDNILPVGDKDWYQLVVDQPGVLTVWNHANPSLTVTVFDSQGKSFGYMNSYGDSQNQVNWNVLPGVHYLEVMAWAGNEAVPWDYAFKAVLNRAVPGETADMAKSPVIPMKVGESRPCGIEHIGDVERFRLSISEKNEYVFMVGGPLGTTSTATDIRTGNTFFQFNAYGGWTGKHAFATEGPMELELTVTAWGNNSANIRPNWIMVGPKDVALPAAPMDWTVDPIDPTKVEFRIVDIPGASSLPVVSLDINADGQPDGVVNAGQSTTLRFPAQGLYRVTAFGETGPVSARGEFWVQATGQPVREGMRVLVATPGEGELIEQAVAVRVTAVSYEGKPIRQVDLQVNGRHVDSDYTVPYEFEVPWTTLAGRACTLTAVVTDASGKRQTAARNVQVSDYFNLLPAAGAVVTGNDVTISWEGGGFGPAEVRYRLKGDGKAESAWNEVIGQNARSRRVRIAGLEAGKVYEFQPLGGSEPGPVREVTRVKGLAFTHPRYGGIIQRDYDQKISVAVRNHADEKRVVRLRCDLPQDSNLLAAFVGEGEKNRPVELEPGEQRAFTLGFSAQDVVKERHELPIYIVSEDGYSDQAQVEVLVKLPKVDLEWVDATPTGQDGLGRTYELINRGDTLTDLNVTAANDGLRIAPEIKHGLLQAGHRMRFEVYPKIFDGFTGCQDEIRATSVGKTTTIGYEGRLKPGEQVFHLDMTAGLDPITGEPEDVDGARRAARRLVGQYLDPATVDWTARSNPQDTDRDGKPDRWTVIDELNRTQWFGRDTDGDGIVDFVQADVGLDGEIDHSSILQEGRWQVTNLLDAWLEMNFAIPQHRSQYEAHDLDLIVNGKIVGRLEQTIPEGNFRFPLAPTSLTWGGGDNTLEINSHFRNYAHYAISSDFQFKTRLLDTDTYMVGTSREDAVKRLFESDTDLSTEGPDFSLSSDDLDLSPRDNLQPGSLICVSGVVRNLGVGSGGRLDVVLFLAIPGTEGKELIRQTVASPGMMTETPFEFVWPAAPGHHSLRIVADPDNRFGESNRKNNAGIIGVSVPGSDMPPVLTVVKPEHDLTATEGTVALLATAVDEIGVIGVDVSVDGGMAKPLYRTSDGFEGVANLQPGVHSLQFRATDSGGLQAAETRAVKVEGKRPQCAIVEPTEGTTIDLPETCVVVSASGGAQGCVRVNRGPWLGLRPTGQTWSGRVDLPFGPCQIEVVILDGAGIRQTQMVTVHCTAQPEEEKSDDEDAEDDKSGLALDTDQDADGKGDGKTGTPAEKPEAGAGNKLPSQTDQRLATSDAVGKPTPAGAGQPAEPAPTGRARPGTDSGQVDPQTGRGPGRESPIQDKTNQDDAEDNTEADKPVADDADRLRPVDLPEENDIAPPPGIAPTSPRPDSPPAVRPSPGGPRRAPAGFAVNRRRNDWYCPNRPRIGIGFKLPEWLTREQFDKILKKGPNSEEFKALERRLLAGYWYRNFGKTANGQTMDQMLLKYKDLLLKRCARLDHPDGKLPGFFESLGLAAGDPPTDPRELEAWRNKMKELTEVYWLRLLATEDPATVMEGMRQRAGALSKFDEASQMQAEAIIEEIQANQKITQDVLEALPYTGEALDLIAAVTGESLSGEQLSGWERFFRAACAAGPVALEEALKRSPRAQEAIGQFLAATGEMSGEMKNAVLRRIGADIDKFDQFTDDVAKFFTKERSLFGKNADDVVDAARNGYRQTAEGIEDLQQMQRTRKASEETVQQLDDLIMKGGKAGDANMEELVLRLQRDKTAQSLMNADGVPLEVRKKANETIKRIYSDADVPTMNRIKQSEDVKKFARDHGLDPDSIEVSVWNPTNTRGPRPGDPDYLDPDYLKYGRDRDVTYQITGKTKDGRAVTLDVNHDVSGAIYKEELYKRCHGGKLPNNMDEVGKFADDMDQMVTSKWNREAYNTGPDVHIDDWLNNDITPPVARPQDIRDTMITKSEHWFHQAADAGGDAGKYSRDMAEGMRQATKQWDNIVAKRVALYGANVPPQLEKAMDIFKQVEKGAISPKQAEHMLQELGKMAGGGKLTPQKVVENMAHYFEAVEKGPGKAFRSIKTAELAKTLEGVGNLDARAQMINDAYRSGQISGEAFRQMREGSFRLPPGATPQQKQQLKDWAMSAWGRRAISLTEKNLIEEQTGPLDR